MRPSESRGPFGDREVGSSVFVGQSWSSASDVLFLGKMSVPVFRPIGTFGKSWRDGKNRGGALFFQDTCLKSSSFPFVANKKTAPSSTSMFEPSVPPRPPQPSRQPPSRRSLSPQVTDEFDEATSRQRLREVLPRWRKDLPSTDVGTSHQGPVIFPPRRRRGIVTMSSATSHIDRSTDRVPVSKFIPIPSEGVV